MRPIAPDELEEFGRVGAAAFGTEFRPEALDHLRLGFEYDRSLAAFDGDRMVGTAGAFSFGLTLPGGPGCAPPPPLPVAAVSFVGVLPTDRRRGVLSAMMRCQLEDVRDRGEAVAVLTASEGGIYGRFGYGVASFVVTHTLARDRCALHASARRLVSAAGGRVRLVDAEEARAAFPLVHEAWVAACPGEVGLTPGFWDGYVRPDPWNEVKGARFLAVHEGPGGVDAFSDYLVDRHWDGQMARSRVEVHALIASDPAAELAMFDYLCGVDLVQELTFLSRPVDDPLRWALADPRQFRAGPVADMLWARPVDPARALAARRYLVPGRLVIDLVDDWMPENTGRLVVEGGPDGAEAGRAGGVGADIALGPAELGSILLGGVAPSALARAGRIDELSPGALARADALFATTRPPYASTEF